MVDQRRAPVKARTRGYGAPLLALIAGLLALIAFDLTHRPAGPAGPHASPRTTVIVTVAPHTSPAGQAPAGRGDQPAPPAAAAAGPTIPAQPSHAPTPVPSPPPSPGPRPPLLSVTAAIVAPLRGATPIAARAAVVIPAAPPFPNPLLELRLALTLP